MHRLFLVLIIIYGLGLTRKISLLGLVAIVLMRSSSFW